MLREFVRGLQDYGTQAQQKLARRIAIDQGVGQPDEALNLQIYLGRMLEAAQPSANSSAPALKIQRSTVRPLGDWLALCSSR